MKNKYFGIYVVFDRDEVDNIIEEHIKQKKAGYVVSLSMNNIVTAYKNEAHRNVINGSIVSFSDSSWFPIMVNFVYKTHFKHYCSAEMFESIVKSRKYKQFFLGNTREVLDGLRDRLAEWDPEIANMGFEELPFKKVEEFDYEGIAKMLNDKKVDIIWVSLGAPKQEQFMNRLLPYLEQGVMFGWGALFNFYSGVNNAPSRAPKWMIKLKMEWLYRVFTDKRVRSRTPQNLKMIPKMIIEEKRRLQTEQK